MTPFFFPHSLHPLPSCTSWFLPFFFLRFLCTYVYFLSFSSHFNKNLAPCLVFYLFFLSPPPSPFLNVATLLEAPTLLTWQIPLYWLLYTTNKSEKNLTCPRIPTQMEEQTLVFVRFSQLHSKSENIKKNNDQAPAFLAMVVVPGLAGLLFYGQKKIASILTHFAF
ncbi:hypothetical protein BC940DRAFT_81978 [Gongronella butleri]|nr:hypothetical protein BC940DRAFT_81978 [Gongronella butleri]